MLNKYSKILVFTLVVIVISVLALLPNEYTSLGFFQKNLAFLQNSYNENVFIFLLSYIFLYIFVTSLSLPFATILTIVGSSIIGFWPALVVVSFSSTIGASLAFFLSRFILREFIENKFNNRLKIVNKALEEDGTTFLLSMRLFPLMPFWMINNVMGVTNIKVSEYFIYSFVGMLPGIILYVYAGQSLSKLKSIDSLMSFEILILFFFLGLLPVVSKYIYQYTKKYQKMNLKFN